MDKFLTTSAVPRDQRIEYWTDLICDSYVNLSCSRTGDGEFDGSIRTREIASLNLSVVASNAQSVLRTQGHIARESNDFFLVSIQSLGVGVVRQDGREAMLSPGDFALYDSTRPYELYFPDDFEQIVLKLPGMQLRHALRETEKLTATAVSGREGAGHLLINMIKTLWEDSKSLQPTSALAIANGVVSVLVAGLQTISPFDPPPLSSLANYHLARIKALIDTDLGDPQLSVSSIASKLTLSTTHIHRLFQNESVRPGQYIWLRRLEACSRDLLDSRFAAKPIGEIGYLRGFSDAAHFSRAFREHFGCSPRDWRQRGAQSVIDAGEGRHRGRPNAS
jgi:AraC-like DNA-binding protein